PFADLLPPPSRPPAATRAAQCPPGFCVVPEPQRDRCSARPPARRSHGHHRAARRRCPPSRSIGPPLDEVEQTLDRNADPIRAVGKLVIDFVEALLEQEEIQEQ